MTKKIERSIFVEAREHTDTNGNSYFSARIEVDGRVIGHLPFQYGYGTQFEHEAIKALEIAGYLPKGERVSTAWNLRQFGIDFYAVKVPAGYRVTKAFGKAWEAYN